MIYSQRVIIFAARSFFFIVTNRENNSTKSETKLCPQNNESKSIVCIKENETFLTLSGEYYPKVLKIYD